MEQYLEILEFILAHKTLNIEGKEIKERVEDTFELERGTTIDVEDDRIDLVTRNTEYKFVTVTSIIIKNE